MFNNNLHETKKKYFLEINEKDIRQILSFLKDKRKSDSEEGIWNSEWFAIVSLELIIKKNQSDKIT